MRKLNGLSIIENEYCYNEWRFDTSTKENGSCHRYGSTEIQGILLIIKSLELTKKRELIIKSSKQTLKEGKNVSPMKEY